LPLNRGVEVCALIHDAVLVAAPIERLEAETARMQAAMAKASSIVLAGFELRSDVKFVRRPSRYRDTRGALMWDRVMRLIAAREAIQHEVA
jgi:DNA polymerase-1